MIGYHKNQASEENAKYVYLFVQFVGYFESTNSVNMASCTLVLYRKSLNRCFEDLKDALISVVAYVHVSKVSNSASNSRATETHPTRRQQSFVYTGSDGACIRRADVPPPRPLCRALN